MEMFKVLFFSIWANAFFLNAYANNFCKYKSEVKSTPQRIVSNRQNQLQSAYDARFHHLNLNIERTNKNISGSVRTIAKVLAAQLDTFAFELHSNLTIDSVICNGTPLAVLNLTHERRAVLPQTFYQNDEIEITIYYRGTPPTTSNNGFGDGFSNRSSPSWGNQISWSLSQPYGAYEWFPCKQALQDKLDSVWVFVTTDSSNRVGSNGLLINEVLLPNGKKRYEWKSKYPIDYYLISVAVGQYVEYKQYAKPKGYNDSILILNYIYNNPQTLPNFKNYIDSTAQMVELFSELYGLYPFAEEKYGHAMAPLSGGMEHQTMSTIGFFTHDLISHELAHQWFGDNVTCSTWSDIFINEGFASYSEYLAKEFLLSKANAQADMLQVHNDVMSQAGGSIWFNDTTDSRIFDSRLSYNKGSAIIHSIRYVVNNDSLFFLALRNFQNQYRYGNGSIEQLKATLEQTTTIDFTQFFSQWIYGEGYPTFDVKWNSNGSTLQLKTTQTTSASTPIFVTPLDYLVKRNGQSDTTLRLNLDQMVQDHTVALNGVVTAISLDPQNWILNKVKAILKDTTLAIGTFSKVEEPIDSKIMVLPNPATTEIFVEAVAPNFTVEIFDWSGRLILYQKTKNGESINVAALPSSTYFGKVVFENGSMGFFRFLKQ
jgi:aminopeptidase N